MRLIFKVIIYLQLLVIPLFIIDLLNNFSSFFFPIPIMLLIFTFAMNIIYSTKFPKNKIDEYNLKSFVNNFEMERDHVTIKFIHKNEIYYTTNGKKNIVLDLSGYPFQINYLIAFITRQYRYTEIHNNLSILYLFKRRFKSEKYNNIKIKLIIDNGKTDIIKMFYVVKNGFFTSSYLTNIINRSKYVRYLWFKKEGYNKISKKKALINEEIYQKYGVRF